MNVAIHSQGVALTEALCLHISHCLQEAAGGFAPLVAQTKLDIAIATQRGREAQVQCRLTMTVIPSTTISVAVSAPTPCAAIGQATAFLMSVMTRPVQPQPTPAVRLPVLTRMSATTLFRRCERTALSDSPVQLLSSATPPAYPFGWWMAATECGCVPDPVRAWRDNRLGLVRSPDERQHHDILHRHARTRRAQLPHTSCRGPAHPVPLRIRADTILRVPQTLCPYRGRSRLLAAAGVATSVHVDHGHLLS